MTDVDVIIAKLSGVAGACLSLAYMKGPPVERITNAIGGAIVSLYTSGWLSTKTGMPEGLTGFLMGLFGMAICAKVWDLIQITPLSEVWERILKRVGPK